MKQSKFSIICKIILIMVILYTPIRYARRAHKTADRIEFLDKVITRASDQNKAISDSIKSLNASIKKMEAEITVMNSQVNKKIQ